MDLLKQLEGKLQSLVQQRNQLREEVDALKAAAATTEEELHGLRRRLEDIQSEKAALVKERDEVKKQVDQILKMVEDMA